MPPEQPWSAPFWYPEPTARPAGYAHLVDRYELNVVPNHCWSFVADRQVKRDFERQGVTTQLLPAARWPGERDVDHLLFALKNDGVSLSLCRALFLEVDRSVLSAELEGEVRRTPTGAYARRAWFLFEQLTGATLSLPDVRQGNYVPLLDDSVFVTGPSRKHRRQRIEVNTLGPLALAPVLRWTPALREASASALTRRIEGVVAGYDDATLRRAISYLYTKETMASFEIEHERPPRDRAERFVALLRAAPAVEELDQDALLRLQNAVVDPRFADAAWRAEQVYVGESLHYNHQKVHFICPKPDDVAELMQGYLEMAQLLIEAEDVDPILVAAVVSFTFVLLHPFTDGNGRLHRWLIHWALSRRRVTPEDIVLPVSAVMLAQRRAYDTALETFSKPLMPRLSWDIDEDGRMTVEGETLDFYRHPDLTRMAEGLALWLGITVDEDLPNQLDILLGMDRARRAVQDIVDMPDQRIFLFIKTCQQNHGKLSKRKREQFFHMLTPEEISAMEAAVTEAFEPRGSAVERTEG